MDGKVPVKSQPKLLLNASSVAATLDIPISLAYAMIRDGRLPSIRFEDSEKNLVPVYALRELVARLISEQAPKTVMPFVLDQSL